VITLRGKEIEMKKTITVLFVFFVVSNIYSQSGWIQQNSGTTSDLWSISTPDNVNYWVVGGQAIMRTSNGGVNWIQQTKPVTNSVYAVKFVDVNTGWASGAGGAIIKTTNGGSYWYTQSSGVTADLWALYFYDANTGWAGSTSGHIVKTTNSGNNWILQTTIAGKTHSNFSFINANTGWVATGTYPTTGDIYKTTNGGAVWTNQTSLTIGNLEDVCFINESTGWITGQNGLIMKTINGGSNWVYQSTGTTLNILKIFFANQNTGWAVGGDASTPSNGIIYKTSNAGNNWVSQLTSTGMYAVCFYNEMIGLAAGDNGVIYKTITGGENTPIAPTLISPSNNSINVSLTPTLFWSTVTGATSYNVLVSSMITFGNIIDSATVTTNQRTIPSGKLNIASTYYWKVCAINTYGAGPWSEVWNFSTILTDIKQIGTETPNFYRLYNNYPNPFNPMTKIRYDLPKNGFLKLVVFDVQGKEIETLVNMYQSAGMYEVLFDASEYASGVYYYRLTTDEFSETRKMILMK